MANETNFPSNEPSDFLLELEVSGHIEDIDYMEVDNVFFEQGTSMEAQSEVIEDIMTNDRDDEDLEVTVCVNMDAQSYNIEPLRALPQEEPEVITISDSEDEEEVIVVNNSNNETFHPLRSNENEIITISDDEDDDDDEVLIVDEQENGIMGGPTPSNETFRFLMNLLSKTNTSDLYRFSPRADWTFLSLKTINIV